MARALRERVVELVVKNANRPARPDPTRPDPFRPDPTPPALPAHFFDPYHSFCVFAAEMLKNSWVLRILVLKFAPLSGILFANTENLNPYHGFCLPITKICIPIKAFCPPILQVYTRG